MKVNFNLKDPKSLDKTPLFVTVVYNTQRIRVHTNKSISPKHWNKEEQKVRQGFAGYGTFNKWIKDVDAFISQIETDWLNAHSKQNEIPVLNPDILKDKLRKYLSKETKEERAEKFRNTFWGYNATFLSRMENGTRVHNEKGTPLSPRTIFQFHNLKRHLQNFETKTGFKITFENIDMIFYKKFIDYLTINLQLSPNTIGKIITNIKVFLREAYEDRLTTNNTFTHRKFKTIHFKSDTVYLNLIEIKEMQDLILTGSPRLERVRDMFIIGCFTGLRYSDLTNIKPENIDNGMIEMVQAKTGSTVVIPFTNNVLDILKKYNYTMPTISNQKFNEYLSLVAEKCKLLQKEITVNSIKGGKKILTTIPKHKLIGSHTARRSFATNENAAGDLDTGEIMTLTGHKSEKSFYKYIRETPKEKAERIREKFILREAKQAALINHLKAV